MLVFVSAFAFLAPSLMFGATSNCPTTSPGTALGTLNTDANGFTGVGTLSNAGCSATDQTFGNFGISGFSGATTVPTISNTAGYTAPDASSDAQNLITNLTASAPTAATGTTASESGDLTLLTQFGSSSPVNDPTVSAVDVTVSGVDLPKTQGSNDASIVVTVYVCEDPSSLNGTSNTGSIAAFSSCSGSHQPNGTLVTGTATLTNTHTTTTGGQTVTVAVDFGEVVDIAAVDVNIDLTSNDNNPVSFSGVSLDFDPPTPEPSPFVLLGSALLGLCVLGARRRKAQRAS